MNPKQCDAGGAATRSDRTPREPREMQGGEPRHRFTVCRVFQKPDSMPCANSGLIANHALSRPRAGRRCTELWCTRQPEQNTNLYERLSPNTPSTEAVLHHWSLGARSWVASLRSDHDGSAALIRLTIATATSRNTMQRGSPQSKKSGFQAHFHARLLSANRCSQGCGEGLTQKRHS